MTIKEIAKLAGVSTAAVSRYFNGGSLSDDKRKKIAKVVEKYSYVPNSLAQTMRTGKSGQIGVIVPHIHSDAVSQIMAGIAIALHENEYSFILCCTDEAREKEVEFIEAMQRGRMDGILLMGTVMTPYLRNAIEKCKIPIVVTGQSFSGVSCVYHDDVHSMKDITRLMLKKRDRVVYIGVNEEDEAAGRARKKGVEKAFEEAGLRKVPKDVSVTGVGNCWADIVSEPQLTTVKLYFEQCGTTAVNLLMRMIRADGEKEPISDIKLGYQIIERGSI